MIDVVDKERQALDPEIKNPLEREEEEARDFIYCGTCSMVIGKYSDRTEVESRFHEILPATTAGLDTVWINRPSLGAARTVAANPTRTYQPGRIRRRGRLTSQAGWG